jgi:hypothetical protein
VIQKVSQLCGSIFSAGQNGKVQNENYFSHIYIREAKNKLSQLDKN